MKRGAPKPVENNVVKRQRRGPGEEDSVEATQIQGDHLSMDIWHAIFNQCDGMAIVPLTLGCKRFRERIMVDDVHLHAKYDSPEGLFERMVTSDELIRPHHKPLLKISLPAALINGVDVKRIAKLLVRMSSTGLCNYVMVKVTAELTTFEANDADEIEGQLANQILIEYAAFHNLQPGTFPADIADFEKYLLDNDFDVWTKFPLSSFMMPLAYFSDSEILSQKILDSALLKIWKEIVGEGDTFTHEALDNIHLAFNNDSSLIRNFHIIAPYLSENAVKKCSQKFTLIATTVHNCSNHHYHELFRLFLSKALDRANLLYDVNFKGCLEKDRRAVCDEAYELKSLFKMAVDLRIPIDKMMESIQKWLTLSSCTQTLRRTITSFLQFNDKVQESEEFSWLPASDVNLAAGLLSSFATSEKIESLIISVWTVECPITHSVILQVASKRTKETIGALQSFLISFEWFFFEEKSMIKPLDVEPSTTLIELLPSALSLRSLIEVFDCIKKPKSILRAIALDIGLVWLNRDNNEFDSTKFHELVSSLPADLLAKIVRFLRKHWFVQQIFHLSGQLAEFYQLFPYLNSNVNEEEIISKAISHKLGPHRMQVSVRRFGLDQTTFDANLAKLHQKPT